MDGKIYEVRNIKKSLEQKKYTKILRVQVPGSKSITNRALLLATLADGVSNLSGVLFSDDSRHFLKCVQDLGFETLVDESQKKVRVTGLSGRVPKMEASLYVGSAGTAARFLTAFLGVSEGIYHMDASQQMRKRPMAPLLAGLSELGCEIGYDQGAEFREGFFPFTLYGHGFGKNEITIDIDNSSQFLSAMLIASCLSKDDFTVKVKGSHGMAYIDMTVKMMEQFGVHTRALQQNGAQNAESGEEGVSGGAVNGKITTAYVTSRGQKYLAREYEIEPDVSAACYFYALAPLLGISVSVLGVHFDSLQGDVAFLRVLEKVGCTCEDSAEGIVINPPADGEFSGVDVDMSAFSDQAITLSAIAPFAKSPTTIRGIGHIRFQECDRMKAIVTELSKMGIKCENTEDSITIYPGNPRPSLVETYEDHRMAMGFSLIGLRADGIAIDNPGCCRKTFENYFEALDGVVAELAFVPDAD